jgi:hypothetical protein
MALTVTTGEKSSASCKEYQHVDWGIFFYFFMGACVLACCLIGFSWINRLYNQIQEDISPAMPQAYESVGSVREGSLDSMRELSPRIVPELSDPHPRNGAALLPGQHECRSSLSESDLPESPVRSDTSEVFKLLRGPTTCIYFTFFVTLALFPGRTSALRSVWNCRAHFRLANDLYTPFTFLLFNVGDLCGRILAGIPHLNTIVSRHLVTFTMGRFLFFPLLFLCTSGSLGDDTFQIQSDLYSLSVQFSLAVSNGILLTTAFARAPMLLANDNRANKNREIMSEMLSFSVAFGLLSGSLFAFPVSRIA